MLCFFLFFFVFSERIDNEIAQEIQEQLVRQAEKQKQQEAKDEVRVKGSMAVYSRHITSVFSGVFSMPFSHEILPRQGV